MLTASDPVQLQYLADKYAPATPDINETLAKLQLPPHTSVDDTSTVPLPRRSSPRSQHDIAVVIRDGRRVAKQLASLGAASKTTDSTGETYSRTSPDKSSMSTALEQDFTVKGKRGHLQCPFSQRPAPQDGLDGKQDDDIEANNDRSHHSSADPICAAMHEESGSHTHGPNGASGSKCPIRYMDQHSPEEIANYVEAHKHELPRSHEVCLRRYQHNEDQIKKIDSKYGNIVSMIEGLGQLHQPMLPEDEQGRQRRQSEIENASNERVQNWAKAVTDSSGAVDDADSKDDVEDGDQTAEDADRHGHFDRPLKEVRVGESPSRPWGISVPVYDPVYFENEHPLSPPPAPVRMPSPARTPKTPMKSGGKCPFGHTKMNGDSGPQLQTPKADPGEPPVTPQPAAQAQETGFTPTKGTAPSQTPYLGQPAFINADAANASNSGGPQMIFTGPVFIGYPVEQALQIINQYRPSNP